MTKKNNLTAIVSTGLLFASSIAQADIENDISAKFADRYLPGVGLTLPPLSKIYRGEWFEECEVCSFASDFLATGNTLGWFQRPFDQHAIHDSDSDGSDTFSRSLIAIRFQNDLDSEVENASSGSFSYFSGDRDGLAIQGAVIIDAYLPSNWLLGGYQTGINGFGLHFRSGVEMNRVTGSAGDGEVDHREYFIGANILAPTIDAAGNIRSAKASEMDFSFRRAENRITDEYSESVVLGWKPAFKKLFRRTIPVENLFKPASLLADPEEGNRKKGENTENSSANDPDTGADELKGVNRFSLAPRFEIEEFVNNTVEDMEGTCLCAGLDIQLITLNDRVKFTYGIDYVYGIEEGDSYFFHDLGLDIIMKGGFLQDASLKFAYTSGHRAPDFKKEELFTAGFGLQF